MWHTRLHEWIDEGHGCALLGVVASSGPVPRGLGARMVLRDDGSMEGSIGGGELEHRCLEEARQVIQSGVPVLTTYALVEEGWVACARPIEGASWVSVFIEPVIPGREIVIFGGGHVGLSLSRLSVSAGIPVRVCEERPEFARRERYPEACRVIHAPYETVVSALGLSERSHCVVCTHSHERDAQLMEQLLSPPRVPYIGLVGSARKLSGIRGQLEEKGLALDDRVYCPAGLALGGRLPGDVALAVLAEIKLLMEGGESGHLRDRIPPPGPRG